MQVTSKRGLIDQVSQAPASPDTATKRRRRQVAVPQAMIARAIRAAREHAGPNWCVEIEGNVIRLSEGAASVASVAVTRQNDKVASEKAWRL